MACTQWIVPDPADITVIAVTEGSVALFHASWRGTRSVGHIQGFWEEAREFLLADFLVYSDVLVSKTPFLPLETRANFRQIGVGNRLLLEMVSYAKHNGARRIYGSVVSDDVKANGDLLDWYRREGFTVREPDEKCPKDAVAMIEMNLDAEGRILREGELDSFSKHALAPHSKARDRGGSTSS